MAIDRRATRLGVLGLVGLILFSLIGVRLWFLQTVKADELQEMSTIARTRTVRVPPERGRIFDVDGRILADNQRILTVAVDWQQLRKRTDRLEIFRRLSAWVDVPIEDMEARFQSQIDSPFLPMPVKQGIDEPTAAALLERSEDFPGLHILTQWKRVYPYAPHASHVIGYMGAITEGQWDDEFRDFGYLLNERVGQFGVEKSMESVLHGTWGRQVFEVDAANRPVRLIEDVPPINGFDVQLTIDLDYQQYAEQALETTLRARRTQLAPNPKVRKPNGQIEKMAPALPDELYYKAPAASEVIMDYTDGSIIAMASYPTFDNRWFEAGLSSAKFTQIFPTENADGTPIDPDQSILVNRAVQGRYNLGSAFKPFTAFAALNTGLMSSGDYYHDTGSYTLTEDSVDLAQCRAGLVRCEFKNATCAGTQAPCKYGWVNVEDALAVSSDAFFYRIGELIMVRNDFNPVLQEQVREFGFGADTGVELPFEFDGTVPDRALKARYADLGVISEEEGQAYYPGDNVQFAIGQGLLSATPMQLTTGYAALANRGFVLQPKIVQAIWNPGVPDLDIGLVDFSKGTIFEDRSDPVLVRQIPMPDEIRDPIVNGLRRVVGTCCAS
ncbi:MAG TPA: penicillin-binding transpeptidase domain-containing protein, partial [Ilumatobacter sp.]|nr:penicillin-binding transpeptidase domain-containing protein [Ilumatobacter sp.]